MAQHNTVHTRPAICVHKLFIVDHCIRLRCTVEIVKYTSHINLKPTISLVQFSLINSTQHDLHQLSRFRVPARYFQQDNLFIYILRQIVPKVERETQVMKKQKNHDGERTADCATLNEISKKKRRSMSLVTHLPIPNCSVTASTLHISYLYITSSLFPT